MQLRRRKLLRREDDVRFAQMIEIRIEHTSRTPDLVAGRRTRIRSENEELCDRHLQRLEIIHCALKSFRIVIRQSENDQRMWAYSRVHNATKAFRVFVHSMKSLVNIRKVALGKRLHTQRHQHAS